MAEKVLTPDSGDWRDRYTWYTHEIAAVAVARNMFKLLTYPFMEVTWQGYEHIPPTGPCVLASNHNHNMDVLIMGMHLPRHPYFMAKVELYKPPVFGWLIRLAGSFPVHRGEKDAWAMAQASRVLAAGRMLFMFPEGTRSRTGQLGRAKVGAVKLALEHQAPLIPAAIYGTQKLKLGGRGTNKVTIRVAPAMDVAAMAGPPPHSAETLRDLTELLMRQIAAMLPPKARGEYG